MRSRRFAFSLPALALAFSLPALALALAIPTTALAADKNGAEGRAKTVEVNAQSSDSFIQYHGRLFVTSGKSTTEYRWGGTSCGSRTMSAEMIQLLVDIVRDRDEIRIKPKYQDGQGSSKCLVGFSLVNKEKGGNGKGGHGGPHRK